MKIGKQIGFVGGDKRNICMFERAISEGYKPTAYFLGNKDSIDRLPDTFSEDTIIGPVPLSKEFPLLNAKDGLNINIYEILKRMSPGSTFAGGLIPEAIENIASEYGISVFDYAATEQFPILNAGITAEGALKIALGNGKKTLSDSNILILGYGRIGKALCNLLSGFNCNFTVTARKESDLSYIRVNGYKGMRTKNIKEVVNQFDIIINTIPALVLTGNVLDMVSNDVLIIDLASVPGGTDFEYANNKGIEVIHALSIPGKYFCYSASSVIYKILHDKNIIWSVNDDE